MGLFGRDDKSAKPQSEPPVPAARPSVSGPSPVGAGARTTIARGSILEGTISGAADIVVEGELKGVVDGSSGLVVAESGRVTATLHGRHVTIAGHVKGDITADERIQLEPSAHVQGNITSPRILIKEGATFDGKVEMKAPAKRGDRHEKADRPDKPAPKDAQEAPGTGPKNGGKASQ